MQAAQSSPLTCDAFLGGALQIWQLQNGYRAGIDPVLLAASVKGQAGDTLLDLGCGVGVAGLCAAQRIQGLQVTGLERHARYADLATFNAAENDLPFETVEGDLAAMPAVLRSRQFDHVIANPPYFDRHASNAAPDKDKETALAEDTPLSVWVQAAAKRAKPNGSVTFVLRADRLPELLAGFDRYLGNIDLLPLIPRRGRDARLVLIRGRKSGRAPMRICDGCVLHSGERHAEDGDDFTPEISAILRQGSHLAFGD